MRLTVDIEMDIESVGITKEEFESNCVERVQNVLNNISTDTNIPMSLLIVECGNKAIIL